MDHPSSPEKPPLVVVDYGMGNVGSMLNMIKKAGGEALSSSDPNVVGKAGKIVLPGVGAFDHSVGRLKSLGLWDVLDRKVAAERTPVLGVCLGMHLFAAGSEEGSLPGFGWLKARVVRFRFEGENARLKIPHMGWNRVAPRPSSLLFRGMEGPLRFYFVHSYHLACEEAGDAASLTTYGYEFPSSIQKGNLYATQFHPEKSHAYGLRLMRNFVEGA